MVAYTHDEQLPAPTAIAIDLDQLEVDDHDIDILEMFFIAEDFMDRIKFPSFDGQEAIALHDMYFDDDMNRRDSTMSLVIPSISISLASDDEDEPSSPMNFSFLDQRFPANVGSDDNPWNDYLEPAGMQVTETELKSGHGPLVGSGNTVVETNGMSVDRDVCGSVPAATSSLSASSIHIEFQMHVNVLDHDENSQDVKNMGGASTLKPTSLLPETVDIGHRHHGGCQSLVVSRRQGIACL